MKINRRLRRTIAMLLDAYKLFHRPMYPKNTSLVYSNATARSGKHRGKRNQGYVISAGQQRLVMKMHDAFQEFFDTDWRTLEIFLTEQLDSFTGAPYDLAHMKELHKLGYVPMIVKAVPEGMRVPYGVPYMTMYNTDPRFFWLTNYLETWMSCEQWNMITATTTAHQFYELLSKWSFITTGKTDFVRFQGHDFSMRGQNGVEAACISGLGHLLSGFVGTDTVPAYLDAQHFYDAELNDWVNMAITGTSVPATEHSVQCAHYNPKDGNELAYLDHILDTFPTGIVSIVCDGFDFWKFITEILPLRKERIMARNGKVVVRPDSGDPADIICGLNSSSNMVTWNEDEPRAKGAIECLWETFGGTVNGLGFKVLDEHIGLIYGDSINLDRAEDICSRLHGKDFASINWVAGIGSYTYQMVTRDTDGQAFKATYIELKGFDGGIAGKNIYKEPKTGDGTKKSAKGLLQVYEKDGILHVKNECTWEEEREGVLEMIYDEGDFHNRTTLGEVRARIAQKDMEYAN